MARPGQEGPHRAGLPTFCSQLHEKFEHLKRLHQEEKRKVEEKRRELEEETNAFNRRKAAVEALQSQGSPGDLLWLSEQLDNVGPGGGAGKAVQGHWV